MRPALCLQRSLSPDKIDRAESPDAKFGKIWAKKQHLSTVKPVHHITFGSAKRIFAVLLASQARHISQTYTQTFLRCGALIHLNMACSMKTSVAGTRLAAPAKIQQSRARVATPVAASLRQEVARVAKGAGVGIASLGLALAANAANVKLGADGGGLVFDPSSVTIKAGESVTWTNNVGFPHNVVFDEDDVPVSCSKC